jgi:hypothetical protein
LPVPRNFQIGPGHFFFWSMSRHRIKSMI